VIDYLGQKFPSTGMNFMNNVIDNIPNISVITKIEVLGFNAPEEHYRLLTEFMDDAIIFDLEPRVIEVCISLRKQYKTKLPDAIIAATALVYDFILISRNISDFKNINSLNVINPHEV
jgi:predicted nucleic acid-binding protein